MLRNRGMRPLASCAWGQWAGGRRGNASRRPVRRERRYRRDARLSGEGGAERCDRAGDRRDRDRQGTCRIGGPPAGPPRHRADDVASIARRSRIPCSNQRCSGTNAARSPAPLRASPAASPRPTTAHCSSTRSARWRLPAQAKLLRILEERTVTPVGSVRPRPIDVRIVAASNQRLEELVAARQFRADLFYRLNVARIDLPPLRARPEDIGPIVDHFIAEQNSRLAMRVGRPDAALLASMRQL